MARKKQETLTLFPEVLEATKKLTDAQFGQLMRSAFSYRFCGELYDGSDSTVDMAFQFLKSQIDRYRESCEVNADNARRAAKSSETPRNQNNDSETPRNQAKPHSYPILSNPSPIHSPKYHPPDDVADKAQTESQSQKDFDSFWNAYPKKVGKQAAKKAFSRVKVPVETLLTAIDRQKCSTQWSKDGGQYIPNPATWLNQGRWEDELEQVRTASTEPYQRIPGIVYC